jgi:Tfp pilus assembly protein PilV
VFEPGRRALKALYARSMYVAMTSRLRRTLSGSAGFTIVEVMVAAILLLVGMLGTVAMVQRADGQTAQTKSREGATALAREILEQTRGIPVSDITQANLVTRLRSLPGLAGTSASPWRLQRRGVTYTVAMSVCAIDDPRDGLGDKGAGGFCPGQSPGTADINPNDFKQVTAQVTYPVRGSTRSLTQTSLIATNGTGDAPGIRSLVAVTPAFANPEQPVVTTSATTSITFEAESTSTATRVGWSLDGGHRGDATSVGSNRWRFTLNNVHQIPDGDYDVGARAFDVNGLEGAPFEIRLRLNRGQMSAPQDVQIGPSVAFHNNAETNVVELEWVPNPERTVRGYRVFRQNGTQACPATPGGVLTATECTDVAPQYSTYTVRAVYENASGGLVEGPATTVGPVTLPPPWGPSVLNFTTTTTNTTSCAGATSQRTMTDAVLPVGAGSSLSLSGSPTYKWCTVLNSSAQGFLNAPSVLTAYASNTSNGNHTCTPLATVSIPGMGWSSTANMSPAEGTVPRNTGTPVARTWTIPSPGAFTMPANNRINVAITTDGGSGCNNSAVHFGGQTYPSGLNPPGSQGLVRPNPPGSVTAAWVAEGLRINFTASPGSPTPTYYRLYKGSRNWTSRIDRNSPGELFMYDRDGQSGQQYWVSAVWVDANGNNLSESTLVGPVTAP